MSEEIKIKKSSGNVFLDMGFSEEEAEGEQLRSYLAYHVYSLFEELKLTPTKAKTHFGIDADDVSRIQEGDFHLFTVPQLLLLLKRLNRNIEIRITPSDAKVGHLQVVST
ncbi:MAG: XRE family transcriptional regulator [Candidatus Poribacteria bacterium]|nr:XRE family transcriptional regulator [Candidatus Poribacteria bacterium]